MKIQAFTLTLALLSSCNNQNSGKENATRTSSIKCYRYDGARDTISLKIINAGDSITGFLQYRLSEKDRNDGNIIGKMHGDMLVADYNFMSEGVQSVRQVVFRKEGNGFIEGYGDIEQKENKTIFRNIDSLTYNGTIKLIEIDCNK